MSIRKNKKICVNLRPVCVICVQYTCKRKLKRR